MGKDSSKLIYRSNIRAISVLLFAWERTEAAACERKEYFARFVDSSAISTSTIRPRAARILVFWATRDSELNASLE